MNIHSEERFDIFEEKYDFDLLSEAVLTQSLSFVEDKRKSFIHFDGNVTIYYYFIEDLCFVIADNKNKNKNFYVEMEIKPQKFKLFTKKKKTDLLSCLLNVKDYFEYELELDITSTRGSLKTNDLIPSLKHQIIAVLVRSVNFEKIYKNLI